MLMTNCFCGMVDRRKTVSFIFSRDYCQRSSPLRISDTSQAGFKPTLKLEWSCEVHGTIETEQIKLKIFCISILQFQNFNVFRVWYYYFFGVNLKFRHIKTLRELIQNVSSARKYMLWNEIDSWFQCSLNFIRSFFGNIRNIKNQFPSPVFKRFFMSLWSLEK